MGQALGDLDWRIQLWPIYLWHVMLQHAIVIATAQALGLNKSGGSPFGPFSYYYLQSYDPGIGTDLKWKIELWPISFWPT